MFIGGSQSLVARGFGSFTSPLGSHVFSLSCGSVLNSGRWEVGGKGGRGGVSFFFCSGFA